MDVKDLKTNMRVKHKATGRMLKFTGGGIGDVYTFITIGGSYTISDYLTEEQVKNYEPVFKKEKQKPPVATAAKVIVFYEGGQKYHLTGVIGFTLKNSEGVVHITTSKDKGKVTIRENVSIPFSELQDLCYASPSRSILFDFEEGKLVGKSDLKFDDNFVVNI